MNRQRILVITPVSHIEGLRKLLDSVGRTDYRERISYKELLNIIKDYDAIFCNPNKQPFRIDELLMERARKLRFIATASTGTNHIEMEEAKRRGIKVISLTTDYKVISRISSTAEHAFAMMLAVIRNITPAFESVKMHNWDYEPFIGRQLDHMALGIIGYGRLGTIFARLAKPFFKKILVYDPYKKVNKDGIRQVGFDKLLKESDVIALHVHVTPETHHLIDRKAIRKMKSGVYMVNTARGEVINSKDLISGLKSGKIKAAALDVIEDEYKRNKSDNPLIAYAKKNKNLLITPHIGGMTREAQKKAYAASAKNLKKVIGGKR